MLHFFQLLLFFAGIPYPRTLARRKSSNSEHWSSGKAIEMKKTLQNIEATDRSSNANEAKMENCK